MPESVEVPNLQTELNCIFSDLSHSGSCGSVDGWEWMQVCLGVSPTCLHIHAHAHMHMHMHNTKIYMYSNCKWPPPWRHPCLSCLTCMCICAYMHAHFCLHGALQYTHTPSTHPPTHPQEGDPLNQLKH